MAGRCPDSDLAIGDRDLIEAADMVDVDQRRRPGQAKVHRRNQALSAGENFGPIDPGEQAQGFVDRPGSEILEGGRLHFRKCGSDVQQQSNPLTVCKTGSSTIQVDPHRPGFARPLVGDPVGATRVVSDRVSGVQLVRLTVDLHGQSPIDHDAVLVSGVMKQ